jgi:hypothetical protein
MCVTLVVDVELCLRAFSPGHLCGGLEMVSLSVWGLLFFFFLLFFGLVWGFFLSFGVAFLWFGLFSLGWFVFFGSLAQWTLDV